MHAHTHTHSLSRSHTYVQTTSAAVCWVNEQHAESDDPVLHPVSQVPASRDSRCLSEISPKNTHINKKSYFDRWNADIELVYFAKPSLCLFKDPFKAKEVKKKMSVWHQIFQLKKVPGLSGHFGQYTIKRLFSCALSVLFCSSIAH